ncbi:MAG: hypothetical protein Q4B92_02775 [Ruminococcus sp.]|nr:hypothetical protein [Ruminococcus sp.]
MAKTIKCVGDIKHYLCSTGTLRHADCIFLLEDLKYDLISLFDSPADSNFFEWKVQEIIYKVSSIQQRIPHDEENGFNLY